MYPFFWIANLPVVLSRSHGTIRNEVNEPVCYDITPLLTLSRPKGDFQYRHDQIPRTLRSNSHVLNDDNEQLYAHQLRANKSERRLTFLNLGALRKSRTCATSTSPQIFTHRNDDDNNGVSFLPRRY